MTTKLSWESLEAEWARSTTYTHTNLLSLLEEAQHKVHTYVASHQGEVAELRRCQEEHNARKRPHADEVPEDSHSTTTDVVAEEEKGSNLGEGVDTEISAQHPFKNSASPLTSSFLYNEDNDAEWADLYDSICTVQAPMVRCSRPAFRKVCRLWGTNVNYTHMFLADSFVKSAHARHADFALYEGESRLIVQLAAKSGPSAAQASLLVAPYCDAIDLNCGCPQRWAMKEGLGSALLDKPELVADMVSCIRNALGGCSETVVPSYGLPCVVKMRVKDGEDVRRSVDFARQCAAAGAGWITVHGRTPTCAPSARVRWEAVRLIQESVSVPVVANGGVTSPSTAVMTALGCNVGSVMSANGLLDNPAALFLPRNKQDVQRLTFAPTHGYLGPYSCCDTSELHEIINCCDDEVLFASASPYCRYLNSPTENITELERYERRLWGLAATPLEAISDFVRLSIMTDLAFPTTIQQVLRMARVYLSPTERSHIALLRSNVAVLNELQRLGLYTISGLVEL